MGLLIFDPRHDAQTILSAISVEIIEDSRVAADVFSLITSPPVPSATRGRLRPTPGCARPTFAILGVGPALISS